MPRPLRIFLCHASQDKPAVRKLHRYLKQHGIEPWLDEIDLLPGENWEVEIPRAIDVSDVILVCLSKNSVNKEGYVQKEISFALDKALEKPDGTIFIIPAKLEDCEVPKRLNRYQWVDLFRPDSNKRLLLGLNKRALSLGSDVSPVILEDTRQRKTIPKPIDQAQLPVGRVSNPTNTLNEETGQAAGPTYKDTSVVKPESKKQSSRKILLGGAGLLAFAILALVAWKMSQLPASPDVIQKPSATQTLLPATKTPMPTVSAAIIVSTPTIGIGSNMISEKDGMVLVYVPNGKFIMGSDDGESDEEPIHTVNLDAFWIDQTEVTNEMYAKCVANGACKEPTTASSYTHSSYYSNSEFDNYPVIYVDWSMAKTYCEWAGRDLPTEAQWEKAARGTDGGTYPWGDDLPTASILNYNSNVGDTTEVGYPDGASVYGALDLSGNVWEWVNDWYDGAYYSISPEFNPRGPNLLDGQYRVLRGGSWNDNFSNVRSTGRLRVNSSGSYYDIGFRCARSP